MVSGKNSSTMKIPHEEEGSQMDTEEGVEKVRELVSSLLKDTKQLNNVVSLLQYTHPDTCEDELIFRALGGLQRVWDHLIKKLRRSFLLHHGTSKRKFNETESQPSLSANKRSRTAQAQHVTDAKKDAVSSNTQDGKEKGSVAKGKVQQKVSQWLWRQYANYNQRLCTLCFHEQPTIQVKCVRVLMNNIRTLCQASTDARIFAISLFSQLIQSVLHPPASVIQSDYLSEELSDEALQVLTEEYINKHPDLLHRAYVNMRKTMQRVNRQLVTAASQRRRKSADSKTAEPSLSVSDKECEIQQQLLAVRAHMLIQWLAPPRQAKRSSEGAFMVQPLSSESNLENQDAENEEDQEEASLSKKEKKKRKRGKKLALEDELPNDATLRRSFSTCWMELLGLKLPVSVYKGILEIMHERILPELLHPTRLFVFLRDSFDIGGLASLLSLHSLFILMTKHNLEYPKFFVKLYSLFDPSIFVVRYREEFWKLAFLFLSSRHLPAAMVAAFVKKIARLSLHAPPAGVLCCIAMLYNLLKKHASVRVLLHQDHTQHAKDSVLSLSKATLDASQKAKGIKEKCNDDPFDSQTLDPTQSNALQSSLWELQALEHHYAPAVVRFLNVLKKEFLKQSYNLEPFASASYHTMIQSLCKRKLKVPPALEFYEPKGMFAPSKAPNSNEDQYLDILYFAP